MDIDWKENLRSVRIRNKALMAWLLNRVPGANVPIRLALSTAKCVEKCFFMDANNEHDYEMMVNEYIDTIPKTAIINQVVLDVTSPMGEFHRTQLCPYYLEGSSIEAFQIRFWILLESLYWFDAPTRTQLWPLFETLLVLINTHPETINAAQQQLMQQPQPERLHIFINDLLHSVGRIFIPQQPVQQQLQPQQAQQAQQPQQEPGRSVYRNIIHSEVMTFVHQIL